MTLETAQRVGVVVVLAVVVGYVWHRSGRGRWWDRLTDRFVYGVPWGSLASLLLVVLVYLFVQSGLESWRDPAVTPFRSWSYSYLQGMLAAGFTHAGPNHLLNNVLAALVFAPLVEYVWGHYPPGERDQPDADTRAESDSTRTVDRSDPESGAGGSHAPSRSDSKLGIDSPSAGDRAAATTGRRVDIRDDSPVVDEGDPSKDTRVDETGDSVLARPLVRAFVLFPAGIILVSLLTSVFAQGYSLGYSGTVFFFIGATVVLAPLATVVGVVALSGASVVVGAVRTPVLRVTADPGAPGPPSWVGINVQAHLLGFLLGVLAALALLRHRDRWPEVGRLALGVVLVVLSQNLWAYATSSGGTFARWQAIGVVFVLCLSAVVVATVAVSDVQVAGPVTARSVAVGGLVLVAVLVALVSVPPNSFGMADDPVPGEGIEVRDYTVTYAENAPHGRLSSNASGVIVVSEQRDIWARDTRVAELGHHGEVTTTVGGVGWRETVTVERSGWEVAGNDTVYAVALEHDDRRVQAFRSDPARADARIAGLGVRVAPGSDGFAIEVTREGEQVGETTVPPVSEHRTVDLAGSPGVDRLTVRTVDRDGDTRLVVEHEETRVLVAEQETYS